MDTLFEDGGDHSGADGAALVEKKFEEWEEANALYDDKKRIMW